MTALIDRLVHRAEIVRIEGRSYREREAHERNARRAVERGRKSRSAKGSS